MLEAQGGKTTLRDDKKFVVIEDRKPLTRRAPRGTCRTSRDSSWSAGKKLATGIGLYSERETALMKVKKKNWTVAQKCAVGGTGSKVWGKKLPVNSRKSHRGIKAVRSRLASMSH